MLGRLEHSSNSQSVNLTKRPSVVSEVEVREGELIWHNERKGYVFVKIGDAEVFLHRSTLD